MGGASVEYFREFASNPKNGIMFVCYQGQGSLGRMVQEGIKEVKMNNDGKEENVKVNMNVITLDGLTAHAGRNELMSFVSSTIPRTKRVIVVHGEISKCLDLASGIYKQCKVETNVPRMLDTLRLK